MIEFDFIFRQVLTGIGGLMAVSATFLLGRKYKCGFIIKALAQIPIIYVAIITETLGLLFYSVPLIVVSLYGWRQWKKE